LSGKTHNIFVGLWNSIPVSVNPIDMFVTYCRGTSQWIVSNKFPLTRSFNRRFTRCTLGFSKKLENLKHAVALFAWHFNFCRVHSAHGKTPAQAAGLTDKALTISELLSATN
jgi:hypothetical protein